MVYEANVPLELLIGAELERAQAEHGAAYASHNEGFGVLAEEVLESLDETRALNRYMPWLLRYVKANDAAGIKDALEAVGGTARAGAIELIQVAAVCEKWLKSLENKEE